jgi:hypothetical protein
MESVKQGKAELTNFRIRLVKLNQRRNHNTIDSHANREAVLRTDVRERLFRGLIIPLNPDSLLPRSTGK